jgi:hypothetical protein
LFIERYDLRFRSGAGIGRTVGVGRAVAVAVVVHRAGRNLARGAHADAVRVVTAGYAVTITITITVSVSVSVSVSVAVSVAVAVSVSVSIAVSVAAVPHGLTHALIHVAHRHGQTLIVAIPIAIPVTFAIPVSVAVAISVPVSVSVAIAVPPLPIVTRWWDRSLGPLCVTVVQRLSSPGTGLGIPAAENHDGEREAQNGGDQVVSFHGGVLRVCIVGCPTDHSNPCDYSQ